MDFADSIPATGTTERTEVNVNGNSPVPVPVVAYIFDTELAEELDKVQPIKTRAFVVHSLIEAYGLLNSVKLLPSRKATDGELLSFHSSTYLEYLISYDKNSSGPEESDDEVDNDFGIGYDCPSFSNMKQFASRVAGGTLAAVESILDDSASISINWCGGWHHAQRDEASGFCYVNDIVIGIQKLQSRFAKILYVDLDSHHGDGVENAFSYTNKVFTLSIHNFEPGYFPGTGNSEDVGFGRGKHFAANIPLKSGINDQDFVHIVKQSLEMVMVKFKPEALVVQCGADCLTGDTLGNSNLTQIGLGESVKYILQYSLPTIFLGGGGYNIPNTAKCWTYLTSIIVNQGLSTDIPEHDYFGIYGPGFDLKITPSHRKNCNTKEYLESVLEKLRSKIQRLRLDKVTSSSHELGS